MSDVMDFEADERPEDARGEAPTRTASALGLTRMSLQELKEKSPAELLAFAEQFDIENANAMRKQDMMFAILKASAEEGIRAFDSCLAGLGGCPYAPGASGNVVTEDLVFMLESMGFGTGIDIPKLLDSRNVLHAGLPAEPMHGQMPKAGLPPTFRNAA